MGDLDESSVLRFFCDDAGQTGGTPRRPRGVVPILMLRSLREEANQPSLLFLRRARRFARLHGRGYARKVGAAMVDASREGADALVIVADRGAEKNRGRLGEMQKGREEQAKAQSTAIPIVFGGAVEDLEAWLLADESAISDASGRQDWERHEMIAERARLDLLVRRCPGGASHFVQRLMISSDRFLSPEWADPVARRALA